MVSAPFPSDANFAALRCACAYEKPGLTRTNTGALVDDCEFFSASKFPSLFTGRRAIIQGQYERLSLTAIDQIFNQSISCLDLPDGLKVTTVGSGGKITLNQVAGCTIE